MSGREITDATVECLIDQLQNGEYFPSAPKDEISELIDEREQLLAKVEKAGAVLSAWDTTASGTELTVAIENLRLALENSE